MPTFPVRQFGPNDVEWRFVLSKSPPPGSDPTAALEEIAPLSEARSRKINLALMRAGDVSFSYPIFDKWAQYFFLGQQYCIECYRNRQYVWSGPLAGNDGESNAASAGNMNVKCVGWLQLLLDRDIRADLTYGATNPSTGLPWKDWEIVFDVFDHVVSVDPAFAPPIAKGQFFGTAMDRQFSWTKGTKVEQVFRDIQEIEAGVDIRVSPQNRKLNVYSWDSYTDRPDITLGFNRPPKNLAKISWQIDFMSIRNSMLGIGNNGISTAEQEDNISKAKYYRRDETVTVPGNITPSTLLAYIASEVAIKSEPIIHYTLTPLGTSQSVPKLYQEFDIGDVMRFSTDYGPVQEVDKPVRTFGASVDIGDDKNEKLSSISISMSGG